MSLTLLVIAIAVAWAAVTGNFTLGNVIFGAAVAALGLFLVRDRVAGPGLVRRTLRFLSLVLLFLRELLMSAVRVGWLVVRPGMRSHLRPGVIAFPLTVKKDAEITLLANLITLTPGTLSVDVSEDHKLLYVHVLQIVDREELIGSIAKGFERKIIEVFE